MTLRDLMPRSFRWSPRWPFGRSPARAGGGRSRSARPPRRPLNGRRRDRSRLRSRYVKRELAAMDRLLTEEMPRLASMYEMFNALASNERAPGAQRRPGPHLMRRDSRGLEGRRPQLAGTVALLLLAAVVTICVTLSIRVRPIQRPCAATAPVPVPAIYTPARNLSCHAYATNK